MRKDDPILFSKYRFLTLNVGVRDSAIQRGNTQTALCVMVEVGYSVQVLKRKTGTLNIKVLGDLITCMTSGPS